MRCMELGEDIKKRREAVGLTQGGLADLLGVTARTVGNWERGKGELSVAKRDKIDAALRAAERERTTRTIGQAGGAVAAAAEAERMRQREMGEIFDRWSALFAENLMLELNYARLRKIEVRAAHDELWGTLVMAQQAAKGERSWIPPWKEEAAMQEEADWVAEMQDPWRRATDEDLAFSQGADLEPELPAYDLAARPGRPDTRAADAQDSDAETPERDDR